MGLRAGLCAPGRCCGTCPGRRRPRCCAGRWHPSCTRTTTASSPRGPTHTAPSSACAPCGSRCARARARGLHAPAHAPPAPLRRRHVRTAQRSCSGRRPARAREQRAAAEPGSESLTGLGCAQLVFVTDPRLVAEVFRKSKELDKDWRLLAPFSQARGLRRSLTCPRPG